MSSIIASPDKLLVADSDEDLADSYDLGDDACPVASPSTLLALLNLDMIYSNRHHF